MHTLYKRKKRLFLIALFSINNVGSFIPAIKALPTESTPNHYASPPLSTLPPRVAMIVKSKENEYARILEYYEYRASWTSFFTSMCVQLFFLGITSYPVYGFIYKLSKGLVRANNIDKEELFGCIFYSIVSLLYLYILKGNFFQAKYPGAIFLTDTGVLFIDCGYNAQYEFIPYVDIKTVQLKGNQKKKFIKIEFVKNFIEYERRGIKYNDKVNAVLIEKENMTNKTSDENAFLDLCGKLSKITEKIHIAIMREKAKQESTQEKKRSLLKIRKEEKGFIDRFEDISEGLHEKTATVQANHPAIFTQIEAYYPDGRPILFIVCVLIEVALIAILTFASSKQFSPKPMFDNVFQIVFKLLFCLLIIFGSCIYHLYDVFMHPAGLFITDTGFLFIEAGKKLQYIFIRYEHIKELLRNVNDQIFLIDTTQSTHEATSLINGAVRKIITIRCPSVKKATFDTLYEHLRLKIAAVEAGKSRLAK